MVTLMYEVSFFIEVLINYFEVLYKLMLKFISLKKEIVKRHACLLRNAGGNLVAIRSTNYLRHASKMVNSDELSIVNTSVRSSAACRICFYWAQKQPRKKHEDEEGEISTLCIPTCYMHACARGASHNATVWAREVWVRPP